MKLLFNEPFWPLYKDSRTGQLVRLSGYSYRCENRGNHVYVVEPIDGSACYEAYFEELTRTSVLDELAEI